MHAETGFIRAVGEGRLESVITHAFGIAEISEGRVEGTTLEVSSKTLASSSTAKTVQAVTRRLEVGGDVLTYDIAMAFGGHELQNHLKAELGKVS